MADNDGDAREEVHEEPDAAPGDEVAAAVTARFPGSVAVDSHGQAVVYVQRDAWHDVATFLRDDERFTQCVDVTAVDANCAKHIKPRWDRAAVDARIDLYRADITELRDRVTELDDELAATRDALTAEAAAAFSTLALRLRERGHAPGTVARFVNRLVFCMFAEDTGLLPDRLFQKMLEASRPTPADFGTHAATLFAAMKGGGRVGFTPVDWFNGGLFDDDTALPLDRLDLDELLAAARLDWSQIDHSRRSSPG